MGTEVSVIIPVYNAEKYLRQCLDSVLAQSLGDIEIICIDDCSADGSPAILREYAARDARMRVVYNEKNMHAGICRNLGLNMASGEYVMFLDADDWFETQMLEELYSPAANSNADIVICKAERFDDLSGKPLFTERILDLEALPSNPFSPKDIADKLFQLTNGQVWDKLFRRSFLLESRLEFPPLCAAEDTSFAYKALMLSERICIVPQIFVHYRVNLSSSVSKSFAKYPDAPYEAFRLVYEFMLERGLMEIYKNSFLNWAAEYLVWQICNAPDKETRCKYYYLTKRKIIYKIGLDAVTAVKIYNFTVYIKLVLIQIMPFCIFSIILDTYRKRKKSEVMRNK